MATPGFGAKLAYANEGTAFNAGSGWTEVEDMLDVTPPESEAEDIDTSSHSTADQFRTYMPGWGEGGEAEVETHHDKVVYATVIGLHRVTKRWRILFSDGSGIGWDGYLKTFGTGVDMEGLTTSKYSFKVSGKPTHIAAVSS